MMLEVVDGELYFAVAFGGEHHKSPNHHRQRRFRLWHPHPSQHQIRHWIRQSIGQAPTAHGDQIGPNAAIEGYDES